MPSLSLGLLRRVEGEGLGACLPTQACYIRCTPECMEVARRAYDLAQKEGRSASRQVSPAQPALQALPPAAAQPPAAAAVQAAVAAAAAQQRQGVPPQAGAGQKLGGKVRKWCLLPCRGQLRYLSGAEELALVRLARFI